jgi:transcriptional regulator with GAF, ATPase, and Fis domain
MVAYLVIREGSKWTDVFRLVPGEVVTVGRAPTNQIVIKDERCSRSHAEIFQSLGNWLLRDLESRNGTYIDGERIASDQSLGAGSIIRIGGAHLAFVHDLAKAFPDSSELIEKAHAAGSATGTAGSDDASVLETGEPTEITHRKGQSRFLEPVPAEADDSSIPKVGRAAAKLCRLAFELAKSTDETALANRALSGLFESLPVDAGGMLLTRRPEAEPSGTTLAVVASRSDSDYAYERVSSFLASTVIREDQAVLARNVMDDSALGMRDSKGEIHTTSVICAPLRHGEQVVGVIHLYSTDPDRALDPDDLEFTLAVADTVSVALENLSRRQELAENLTQMLDENIQLRERLGVQSEIVGRSAATDHLTQEIGQAAPSRATVLIRGESGVGKELVARAVHFSSPRRKGPFVCLNCAALAETLLESELFGHEKGAFTGATNRKIGKFEAADRGTLMLDEIGEMSPTVQAKFLRVLEGHPFERVGGSQAIEVDVRVIAATNRDLEKDVADGRFRRDLYFRLHVLEIRVPPLRKRPEDVPVLAEHFLDRFRSETGRKIHGFTPAAMELMLRYRWPGNVRELKNVIERAVVLASGEMIGCDDLTLSTLATVGDTDEVHLAAPQSFQGASLADMEREHIRATLKSTSWNKSRAAGILGIERSTLDRKIRRHELVRESS